MIQNQRPPIHRIAFPILIALSISHCLNDMLQSVISAVYPLFKVGFILEFCPDWSDYVSVSDVGVRVSASNGIVFDKRPIAWSLPIGMGFTLVGIMNLAFATNLYWLLASVFIVGIGSSVLHPEASRITFLASGGKRGLAQSLFQVGGNLGGSLGPLLVALLVAPYGRHHIALFTVFCLDCHRGDDSYMSLVPFLLEPHQETPDACGRKDRTPSFLKDDGVCHKYSADTYLLQIYLYGKFDELLYILSDP
mgnify:CR=1 FL=1